MSLLVDFLCRFGWGLSASLVLTPAALVPAGFFRVNMLVVMGLATFAALLAGQAVPTVGWILPAAAAVCAWLGSIAWLGERVPAGRSFCVVCALLLAAATAAVHGAATAPAGLAAIAMPLLSGLVTGLTVHAMLLGHWYLNAPGMRVDVLRTMIDAAIVAWGVQLAATLVVAAMQPGHPLSPAGLFAAASPSTAGTAAGGQTTVALLWLRWLAGLVGLPVLLWLARETLAIPNTQSATGILYVACLAAILGELTAQLLTAA